MLENVSWGVFLKLLGIVLTCYYGVVVIRYFRPDVSSLLLKGKRVGLAGMLSKNTNEGNTSLDNLSALLAEIDSELMANAGKKAEVIQLLRQKVGRYGLPDSNSARKILLNHLLLAVKAGQVDLEEEDLLVLFNTLPN
ncbi:hypothetical protein U3A58_17445 [Algoriphagus sp. C2-6-M1]|uniref:hypothetical protein n=1 Tax=Algoriphagus persicinus TaxID=3108754 RepID=UPI002B379F90|nr:hypothetical protein [Algoriphagus sp. C2-6-M1]MEB2782181.1 hypothetical protein [Algoriphagus sp. C2-6-M1]